MHFGILYSHSDTKRYIMSKLYFEIMHLFKLQYQFIHIYVKLLFSFQKDSGSLKVILPFQRCFEKSPSQYSITPSELIQQKAGAEIANRVK